MKITKRQLRRIIREADVPDELLGQIIGSAESLDPEDPEVKDLLLQTLEDNPEALQDMLGDSPEIMGGVTDFLEKNPEAVPEEVTDAVGKEAAADAKKNAADIEDSLKGMTEIKKGRQRMRITRRQLRTVIKEVLEEDKSGKGKCPDTGCIKKSGDKWRIISNKTGKMWPQHYDTKEKAENALKAYHVHN